MNADTRRTVGIVSIGIAIAILAVWLIISFFARTPGEPPQQSIAVKAGTYSIGCSLNDSDCKADEKPRHKVTLEAFFIDPTPVTNAQYRRCVAKGACSEPKWPDYYKQLSGAHPVVGVDWYQAHAYCTWAGKRLPTEAEWEVAARAGSDTALYGVLSEIAWYKANTDNKPEAVAKKEPNAWGLYDTIGNVWEWTSDWYDEDYYSRSPKENPKGPPKGDMRAMRGGNWNNHRRFAASMRSKDDPSNWYDGVGFRCARDAD